MAPQTLLSLSPFFLLCLLGAATVPSAAGNSYIVYLGAHSHSSSDGGGGSSLLDHEKAAASHLAFLSSYLGDEERARSAIFYSYTKYVNGFAAVLAEEEAAAIGRHPAVVSVFRNEAVVLHTTRSWEFLGVAVEGGGAAEGSVWAAAAYGEDVIVGNLDTGVWPESASFDDEGLGPVPERWRGKCQAGVTCNRKLIGARYYDKGFVVGGGATSQQDYTSGRDFNGHGSHTLSTAAGRRVPFASIFGYANGTAAGGAPAARVASYKVCYATGSCYSADILAAFDDAIHDGVDVLSVSLGGVPTAYLRDSIAIGAFHATQNNVTVVASAGNAGPQPSSVTNVAPWIFTVAASTIDRRVEAEVVLQTGQRFVGQSLSSAALPEGELFPVINAADAAAAGVSDFESEFCLDGALDGDKVRGNIVVCLAGLGYNIESGAEVSRAGGLGMVLIGGSNQEIIAQAHVLPVAALTQKDGLVLLESIRRANRTVLGTVTRPVTVVGTRPSPTMAGFSSRGPNGITPQILKPDITAPGVNILAAHSEGTSPSGLYNDNRTIPFTMLSGTSMSCPHVAGVAGLLKALHPDWSPAAIRSAIMTTSTTLDNSGLPITNLTSLPDTPFGYGAGHVRPNAAADPGLVYDLSPIDYVEFLCSIGYTASQIKTFTNGSYSCKSNSSHLLNFNYPAIAVPRLSGRAMVSRTVKNVGLPGTYTVDIEPPPGVSISVDPERLVFDKVGEEKMFRVTLQAESDSRVSGSYVFGKLVWTDEKHYVSSPIVVNIINGS